MIGNTKTLPEGYEKLRDIDLKNNRRELLIVNVTGALIAAVMVVAGHLAVPIQTLFDMSRPGVYFARFGALLAAMIAYLALHEAVHGVVMYRFCPVRPTFGLSGPYAYAGSAAYFNRRSYIVIALAPVAVWGVVLAVIGAFVSGPWFWVVYFTQIINISGAAGDLYVTTLMLNMPEDILVRDAGVSMTVYAPPGR